MKPSYLIADSELIVSLRMGDKNAFDIIYLKFAPELYRFAQKNIGSNEDAKEIVHDVFLSLWSRHASLHIENIGGYLLMAVRKQVAEYFRKTKTRQRYALHYKYFESVYDPFDAQPAQPLDTDDLHKLINHSLPALPEKCQEAFRMRLFQNLSNAEIALRMNVKKTTVEHYMFQAVRHLRASYKTFVQASIHLLPIFIAIIPV